MHMERKIQFEGCLFDLDGTLIDSYPVVNRSWTKLAVKHHLDPAYVLRVIHGRPASESIRELLQDQDPVVIEQEIKWMEKLESEDTDGILAIEGAIQFLNSLNDHQIPWAIVTSGTYPVASARIKAMNLPSPSQLITADLITKGKPDPEPFLLGAEKLGIDIEACVVFEDAPAGIQAGIASKAQTVGILSHHDLESQFTIDCIKDFRQARIQTEDNHFVMRLAPLSTCKA